MPANHGHDHSHKLKPKGPKERELAVALTVAVLNAARIAEPVDTIEKLTVDIYERMLAAVAQPGSANGAAGRE